MASSPPGRPRKYDWDAWCDGRARHFITDTHFTCKPESFIAQFQKAAKDRGRVLDYGEVPGGFIIAAIEDGIPEPQVLPEDGYLLKLAAKELHKQEEARMRKAGLYPGVMTGLGTIRSKKDDA